VNQTQPTTPAPVAQKPTQLVDETANWKTYSSAKYGFTLKYPGNWNYGENEIPKSVQESASKGDGYVGPEIFTFNLGKDDPQNADSGIGVTVIKKVNKEPAVRPDIAEGDVIIDDIKGVKYSGSYYVEKNGYIYQLYSFGGKSYYNSLFEKIVSNFKFTK
jgi:hypothetical protein